MHTHPGIPPVACRFRTMTTMRPKLSAALIVLPLALGLAGDAWAGRARGQGGDRPPQQHPRPAFVGPERGQGRDELSDSVRRVERDTRGRVLSAERVPYDGRDVNRIKVVDGTGRVRVIMDDPDKQSAPAAPARDDDN